MTFIFEELRVKKITLISQLKKVPKKVIKGLRISILSCCFGV